MVAVAKVFNIGNSQAIRLPRAYRVDEMWISKNERKRTGGITLKPKPEPAALAAFLAALQSMPASEEFLLPRDDAPCDDPLAGWAA